jgi:hypothetical protein
VLVLAIIGSLGAILMRSVTSAQANSSIIELRRSLPQGTSNGRGLVGGLPRALCGSAANDRDRNAALPPIAVLISAVDHLEI